MPVIGLTGNIASGKSHIAEIFKGLGAVVQNSDLVAHEVMNDEAFAEIAKAFPAVIEGGKINRSKLGAEVFNNDAKLKILEKILHPLVRKKNVEFIRANHDKLIVLEIPLLFETNADAICNYIVFAHVSPETQRARALARPGITEEKLQNILKRQTKISIDDKMAGADFVIENEPGKNVTKQVEEIIFKLAR